MGVNGTIDSEAQKSASIHHKRNPKWHMPVLSYES